MNELKKEIETNLKDFNALHAELLKLSLFNLASKISKVYHEGKLNKYLQGLNEAKEIYKK